MSADTAEHNDQKTHDYFDNFTPSYRPERFQFAVDFINEQGDDSLRLLDIGCGDGATLAMLKNDTNLKNLVGLDISPNYLAKARDQVGCETIEGSILDPKLVAEHAGQFDLCSLGAVIHHLIGDSRKESTELGATCVKHSMELLKPGGHLIIFEPTYTPKLAMDAVFRIKKTFTKFSSNRIEFFKSWANFGEPVVSYYTPDMLEGFIKSSGPHNLKKFDVMDDMRFGGVLRRRGMGCIIQRG